jgi:hypothetical protein
MALSNLGSLAEIQGDLVAARAFDEQALELFRAQGVLRGVAITVVDLGRIALQEHDYQGAHMRCHEGLSILREQGTLGYIGECFLLLAAVAGMQARPALAACFAAVAQRLRSKMNAETASRGPAVYDPIIARVRAQVAPATWAAAWNKGSAMTIEAAIDDALQHTAENYGV